MWKKVKENLTKNIDMWNKMKEGNEAKIFEYNDPVDHSVSKNQGQRQNSVKKLNNK
mgnify:CR=1 FL=1